MPKAMHRVKIYYFMKIKIKQNENGREHSVFDDLQSEVRFAL